METIVAQQQIDVKEKLSEHRLQNGFSYAELVGNNQSE